MVRAGAMTQRIERLLGYLVRTVADLPEVAAEWKRLEPASRATWSLDWHQTMVMDLPFVQEQYRARTMTKKQRAHYEDLLRRLKECQPIIERLGISQPHIPLEV